MSRGWLCGNDVRRFAPHIIIYLALPRGFIVGLHYDVFLI
ncbi:hypothetical protein APA_5037 [Pseudanabaena sp. lw0831]|nr:hypothetical protein APA_5037 [Pseudanabaena sp. lw0831]